MNISFDLETIPAQRPDVLAEIQAAVTSSVMAEHDAVTVPGNISKPETIDKWWSETGLAKKASILAGAAAEIDKQYRATALDGAFGQIAVIGFAIDDQDPKAVYTLDWASDEAEILKSFYSLLQEATNGRPARFVGHNVTSFDLRFLRQRSVVNGIKPPSFIPFDAKPWETEKVFDTMTAWCGVGQRIKLDTLCKVLGIPGKPDGLDGSRVWDFIRDGRIAEVADYCKGDVERTRACFKRLTFF